MELAQEKSGIKMHKAHADRNKGTGGVAPAEHLVLGQIPVTTLHSKDLLHSTGKMQHRLISFTLCQMLLRRAGNASPKGDNEPTLHEDHHKPNPVWLCKVKTLKNCRSPQKQT